MRTNPKLLACAVLTLAIALSSLCVTAYAQRRLSAGETMPEFTAVDLAGQTFGYKHGGERVLMVVFLSAGHERAARAAADIQLVVSELGNDANNLDVLVAVDDPNATYFKSKDDGPAKTFRIVSDADFKLWGKFGIIVTPTVIVAGADDKVVWAKPGHGYTFAPLLRSNLNRALGIAQESKSDPNDVVKVKAVVNDTATARIKRHLQMARILENKGRLESAIAQLQQAKELDPNSVDVVVALAELHCRTGQGKKALDAVNQVNTANRLEKARLLLISGWATRQMGELDAAEKLLLEATTLNPKFARAFFELGKIYQAREQPEKAMTSYYRALALIFPEPVTTDFPAPNQSAFSAGLKKISIYQGASVLWSISW